jgi:3-dehydroquinate dehydratase/shikimate dehydrogenase
MAMAEAEACRVIKVAWRARSLRDNVEAFELIRRRLKPTIALCMGEAGLPSRVLAKKFGALLTFACLDETTGTAPGQPTVEQLKNLYRWDAIGPDTRVYGVIGHPVGHSMSPPFHNAGFNATEYDGVYLPMPIPPEYEHFKATVLSWLDYEPLHFRGASVTIPHKQNLLRFVEEQGGEIEPLAAQIGAANTLTKRDDGSGGGSLYASNTDYAALLDAVTDAWSISREELAGQRVAVLGAGGAARAAVAAFTAYRSAVTVFNRTPGKAQTLADQFRGAAAPLPDLDPFAFDLVINTTPVGMHPHIDDTPVGLKIENRKSKIENPLVFDTIYNPLETRLLREAKAAGCATIPGTEMFVRQGAAQFQLWTGLEPPLDVFRRVLHERLVSNL